MKTTSKISTLIMAIAVTGMLAFGGATTAHAQDLVAFMFAIDVGKQNPFRLLVPEPCEHRSYGHLRYDPGPQRNGGR